MELFDTHAHVYDKRLDNAWYSDGIHPNEKGYSKFADIAAPYMSI